MNPIRSAVCIHCDLIMSTWPGIDKLPGETDAPGEESDPSSGRGGDWQSHSSPHPCGWLPQDGCSQGPVLDGLDGPCTCHGDLSAWCRARRGAPCTAAGRRASGHASFSVFSPGSCLDSRAAAFGLASPWCFPRSSCFLALAYPRRAASLHALDSHRHLPGAHGPPLLIGKQAEAQEERTRPSMLEKGAGTADFKSLPGKP